MVKNWDVEDAPTRDIDIPVAVFKGQLLLNGSSFPNSPYETGRVYAVTSNAEDEPVLLNATLYGSFEQRLLAVSYRHNGALLPVDGPQNARVHLARGRNYLRLYDSMIGPQEMVAMAGTFDLFYQFRGGPGLPMNAFMRIGCWTLER